MSREYSIEIKYKRSRHDLRVTNGIYKQLFQNGIIHSELVKLQTLEEKNMLEYF